MTRIRIQFIRSFFLLFVHAVICLTPCFAMDLLDDFPSHGLLLQHDTRVPIGTINRTVQHAFFPTGTPINEIAQEVARQRESVGLPPEISLSEQERFFQEFPWQVLRNQFVRSPMPGKVMKIYVKKGDVVEAGDYLGTIEAMKMQNTLLSLWHGTIKTILYKEGDTINNDSILISLLPSSADWENIDPTTSPHHETHLTSFFPWTADSPLEDSPLPKGGTEAKSKKGSEDGATAIPHLIEASADMSPTPLPLPSEVSITQPSPVPPKEEVLSIPEDLMDDVTAEEISLAEKTQDKENAHIPPQVSEHDQNIVAQTPFTPQKLQSSEEPVVDVMAEEIPIAEKNQDKENVRIPLQVSEHDQNIVAQTPVTPQEHREKLQHFPTQSPEVPSPLLTQERRDILLPSTTQIKPALLSFKSLTTRGETKSFRRSKTPLNQDTPLFDLSWEDLKGASGATLLTCVKTLSGLMSLGILLWLFNASYIIKSCYLTYFFPNTVPYHTSILATIKWLQAVDFNQQNLLAPSNINSLPQKRFKIA